MNRLRLLTFLAIASLTQLAIAVSNKQLVINELMISNIDGYMVEYDYPDSWIELYNPTSSAIDIKGMKLCSGAGAKEEYVFSSSTTIQPGKFLVIPCDKKASKLHTSFRLDARGGELFLYDNATLIDHVCYPAMIAPQIAYGRTNDVSVEWEWEKNATPGKPNVGPFLNTLLPDPEFSIKGQVMQNPARVEIQIPSGCPSDTKIYITFNGSEPTEKSKSATSFSLQIDTTTVIRAKLMSSAALSPRSVSQSYIFHPRPTTLPIISLLTDSMHLYDPKYGIFSSEKTSGNKANYDQSWRRPINFEYLGLAGQMTTINQLTETGVAGASSRAMAQKSMKIFSHQRFGHKHIDHAFWADKPEVKNSKSIMLRNGGSNCYISRINDAFAQRLFGTNLDNLDWQAYAPAIVYINGRYEGYLGLRERTNQDHIWANYDGEEDIDLVEDINQKDVASYVELKNLFSKSTTDYATLEPLIDMDEWANLLCLQIYTANTDWPFNNVSIWRRRDGGKWRWITKDIDFFSRAVRTELTPDPLNFNYFRYLTISGPSTSQEYKTANRAASAFWIFKKLLRLPEFRDLLVDKLSVFLGDFVNPQEATQMLWQMHDEIIEEVEYTYRKINPKMGKERCTTYVQQLDDFMQLRNRKVYEHITEFYGFGSVIPMTVQKSNYCIQINGVRINTGHFDGAYFSNRALRLSSGASNIGWKMKVFHRNSNGVMQPDAMEHVFENPDIMLTLDSYRQCDSVAFSLFAFAESEFDSRIKELALDTHIVHDWSQESDLTLTEPSCAYANITGIAELPSSKQDNLQAYIDFYDGQGNYFRKKILLNLQGGSSSNQQKKNLSINFCEDEWEGETTTNISFGEWVVQDEFHLKAYYNDYFRGIPAIGYKLYNQMTQTLGQKSYAWQRGLSAQDLNDPTLSIYDEARCFPDAFPCVIYVNGGYYGTFCWQLKKQRKNMNLTKNIPTHIHLDGTLNDKQLFRGEVNWEKFEIRNPKDLYYMDGTDYDGDYPAEIMDESSPNFSGKKKQIRCAEVKSHILALSAYYDAIQQLINSGARTEEIRTAIEQRFDVTSMIDYLVFSLVTSNYEGFSKNWQWFTYDGGRWFVAPYDLDLTFGYNEENVSLWPASQSSKKYDYQMNNIDSNGPMYWIKHFYWAEVCDRYQQLRSNGVFSVQNIMNIIDDWYNRIGETNRESEWKKWPQSPCLVNYSDSQQRIRQWIEDRLSLEDSYLNQEAPTYELSINETEWATICVPFSFEIPQSMKVFTISGIDSDGRVLELTDVTLPLANHPYLVTAPNGTYHLCGTSTDYDTTLTNGLLTGTNEQIFAPAGSYVLQHQSHQASFYHVAQDQSVVVPAHHAYLTLPTPMNTRQIQLPIDGNAIEYITGDQLSTTEYNYWGMKTEGTSSHRLRIVKTEDGRYLKTYR